MSRLRVQAMLLAENDKAEDNTMNVFHFQTTNAVSETEVGIINSALTAFYSDIYPGTTFPDSRSGDVEIRIFDLADAVPRAPISDVILPTGNEGSDNLPSEMAICLSFRAQLVSGGNKARRRGRLYLGPWGTSANDAATGRPTASLRDFILTAAGNLWDATTGNVAELVTWEIYSPTDDLMREVARAYVDDAWDVQRRRGIDPQSRVQQIFTAD